MSYYHEGHNVARAWVMDESRTGEELLEQLDTLYWRENLSENYTMEELRLEALAQVRVDFTDYSSPEYERARFWIGVREVGWL
jgi:hypothetical protein